MKIIHTLLFGFVASTLLFTGCFTTPESKQENVPKPTITEESMGLRTTEIYTEDTTTASKTEYTSAVPGTSHKFKRAFQDAPPMIPHSLKGLIPIKADSNQCLSCHMPAMAKLVKSTPIPKSHFTNFRPSTYIMDGKVIKSGVVIRNTSSESLSHVSIVKQGKLVGARFNCTQCHAPQSQGNLAVENNFEADYTSKDGASRSSWIGTKLMEGIDTTTSGY
ncbi:nitrate reductase cytochrome c-type subunit [Sulfurimonas sp. SAG-AH-194-I05]|nr:nitrate reductase cytochrome c-type subunit [Sulfurimonas sp. SAG-AH-194-I05]MDF1874455.1 nitrate reductase cytochrome c-type subunit [Sulfurimonas sp. SAG-AH-194-I05]